MSLPREELVFEVSFQSLQRALGDLLTDDVKASFREVGVDFDTPLKREYPFEIWRRAFVLALDVAYPRVPQAEREFQMGRRLLGSFAQTIIGGVVVAMAKVAGPRRMLDRAARSMRVANNYSEVSCEEVAPGTC